MRDYYEILGVNKNADDASLKELTEICDEISSR